MTHPRIAVLRGGPSFEHDVSMRSGAQVLAALPESERLDVRIARDGVWHVGDDAQPSLGAAIDALRARAEVVFIALHGPFGEDGTVQGLLQTAGLAYVGSGVAASSLAMDKARAKLVYRARGLPTPDFRFVTRAASDAVVEATVADAAEALGLPVVVKPTCNGSSYGVSFPEDRATLTEAVLGHVAKGDEVLIEAFVKGTELTCGVLEDAATGALTPLPVTEIVPTDKYAFFDYEAKYTPGATHEITPARIPDALRDEVQRLAVEAHVALGCRDMSRTDALVLDGAPLLLETNTVPGFTAQSLLPQAAAAAGLDFPALVKKLVDNARHRASEG